MFLQKIPYNETGTPDPNHPKKVQFPVPGSQFLKKSRFILLFTCLSTLCFGQITVEECYRLARENYPLVQRYDLISLSEEYTLRNASKTYLPQFSLSAKATYQTDVTSLSITLPGFDIPMPDKDQYQVLAKVSQTIWDGGNAKASQKTIRAQGNVDRAQFETDLYAIRERIHHLFFGILLVDEQIRLNALYSENLQINQDRIVGYTANGIANQADLDAVRVELLGAGQERIRLQANRTAYLKMLSAFIGQPLYENTTFIKPAITALPATGQALLRPEMELYNATKQQMETQRQAIHASNMPQLGLFIQGGYGKPGLNMLQDKFKAFAIGGVRFSWNLGNFYTRRNNLRKIETGIRQIEVQQETFLFNNDLQQTQLNTEYHKYRQVIEHDDEIIRIRENIVRASEAKLENGTISTTDLMRDMIAAQNARVNKAIHEIELLQTVYGIKNLTNN